MFVDTAWQCSVWLYGAKVELLCAVCCLNLACLTCWLCCSDAHDISVRHLMLDVMSVILRESEHIPKELVEGILLQLLTSDEVRGSSNPDCSSLSEVHVPVLLVGGSLSTAGKGTHQEDCS